MDAGLALYASLRSTAPATVRPSSIRQGEIDVWARASAARVDGHPDRAGDGEGRQGVAHLMGAVDSEADGLRPPRGTGHEAGPKLGVDLNALCHQVGAAHSGAADRVGQHPGGRAAGHGPNPGVVAIEDGGSRGRQGFTSSALAAATASRSPKASV